jgi:cytochrome c553
MKMLGTLMAIAAVAGLMLVGAPREAQARLQYKAAVEKKYTKIADELKTEAKCNACHGLDPDGKSNKKLLSDYAMALKEALGKMNERDKDAINKAIDTVGAKKNGDGKPYAELMESGSLPAPHESVKK